MHRSGMNDLLSQLSNAKGNRLIQQCISTIEDLQKELQQQIKINQQQKHLINILQEGKQYYEQEYKNNHYQIQCQQLTSEINRITVLANAHRKASQQLIQTVHHLQQNIQHLESQLTQKELIIQQSQMMMNQIKGQKELLEKQWNKVIKAVKRKIANIVERQDNHESNKENYIVNRLHTKKDVALGQQKRYAQAKFPQKESKLSLIDRAYNMVAQLQKEEAIEEFEGIFFEYSNRTNSVNKSNKKREALKENNQINILFNSEYQ